MSNKIDIYQEVTNSIIDAIENGSCSDFELPWHNISGIPQNARTGNAYQGINTLLLWAKQRQHGFKSGKWATIKQWNELGGKVIKGSKGTHIVFWKLIEIEPQQDNKEIETRAFARFSTVFNADQIEGIEIDADITKSEIEILENADSFIKATGANIRHGETQAYYNITQDYINLPCPALFKDTEHSSATENYFSTAFHEIVHWSGNKKRLDRFQESCSEQDYAFEELIAEIGAAMLCSLTGVSTSPRADHASYVNSWLKALKGNKHFIFKASSQAQKAVDYLLSFKSSKEDIREAA